MAAEGGAPHGTERDGTAPATLANVILLGEDSADYRARVVYVTVVWRY